MPPIRVTLKGPDKFTLTGEGTEHGDMRRYYVAKLATGKRMIVVCRNGLELTTLAGCTVDASIGWDFGTQGFVQDLCLDKRHTKVTIYRKSNIPPRLTLQGILHTAPNISDP